MYAKRDERYQTYSQHNTLQIEMFKYLPELDYTISVYNVCQGNW